MKKTRITMLITNLGTGGAQHMVHEMVKYIDKAAFDVTVLCCRPKNNDPLEALVERECPVIYLGVTGPVTPITLAKVFRAIQKTKPDVVHAHMGGALFGAMWSALFKKRLVITVHTRAETAFRPNIKKQVQRALKAGMTKMVAVSFENARAVKENFGLDNSKCTYVNNGIDLARFTNKAHEGFVLINVAHHDENKNQAALIRCFARLHEKHPDTKLLLLGDGPTHQDLMVQAAELGVANAVTFTGNVPNTQDYYAVSDLYVQCSFVEAMPLSVLEAMAAGLPIVSTHVGGLADVVQDNGILVPAGDEEALYCAIEKIYTQTPEQTQTMCDASGRLVQDYSSESMARAYEKIYEEMQQ